MSANLQNLLRDALLNNTYDYDSMHGVLKKTWENSYSYLYLLQKNYIEYEELQYYSNDFESRKIDRIGHLYVDSHLRICFDIEYDFIHVCNREEFRLSDFYFKEFTVYDMINNPNIFLKIPIVLINNKAIWDYKLKAHDGSFTVILPFNNYKPDFILNKERNPKNDEYIYLNNKTQVLTIDNVYYNKIERNRTNLNVDLINKTISIDTSSINTNIDKEGIYCISIVKQNSSGIDEQHGTIIYFSTIVDNKLIFKISESDLNEINLHPYNFSIHVLFVNKLYKHVLYNGKDYTKCVNDKCNLFVLQKNERTPYAMPIPVEDLIVFKKRNGVIELIHNVIAARLHYPNIYEIVDHDRQDGDEYYIYYFYEYSLSLKYSPIYDYYMEFLSIHFNDKPIEEILDSIYNNSIDLSGYSDEQIKDFTDTFEKILKYHFYNHRYNEIDFYKRYHLEAANQDKHYIEYKDETLRDWISINPYVLRDYVIEQDKLYTAVYHLWTNAIDLNNRIRTNTELELGNNLNYNFSETHYVFGFRDENTTSGKVLNARVFVDGIFIMDIIQKRQLYTDYFYIPTHYVTDDSYIEIEVFPSYEYSQVVKFESFNDIKSIDLFEPKDCILPTAEDLYYVTPSGHVLNSRRVTNLSSTDSLGNDTITIKSKESISINIEDSSMWIYDNDFFALSAEYTEGEFNVKTSNPDKPVKFTRLNSFKIKPLSEKVLNKDIAICISKIPNGLEYTVMEDGHPFIAINENNFKFNIDYLRIFRNGRLIPRTRYAFFSSFEYPKIYFIDYFNTGDKIFIDITPYKYKEIYYQEKLEEKQTLIDLKDYITKPFDIRYYDVYMNGRKLSLNNVFTISPWSITLTNLSSLYNLQIFEKERDYEYFGTNYRENQYYYTLDDLFNSSFITEDERNEIIRRMINEAKDEHLNIKPNTNDEDKIDCTDIRKYVYFHMFYFDELIPKTFVNPDLKQYKEKTIMDEYTTIHEMYKVHPSDYYRNDNEHIRRMIYTDAIQLNPDKVLEGRTIEDETTTQYVYCVGHMGDDALHYLTDKITVNTSDYIINE